jgi:hypothetical protein
MGNSHERTGWKASRHGMMLVGLHQALCGGARRRRSGGGPGGGSARMPVGRRHDGIPSPPRGGR